jgi:hypothetical protein
MSFNGDGCWKIMIRWIEKSMQWQNLHLLMQTYNQCLTCIPNILVPKSVLQGGLGYEVYGHALLMLECTLLHKWNNKTWTWFSNLLQPKGYAIKNLLYHYDKLSYPSYTSPKKLVKSNVLCSHPYFTI